MRRALGALTIACAMVIASATPLVARTSQGAAQQSGSAPVSTLAASTINVNFSANFPSEARTAFQFAVNAWQSNLHSVVPLTIQANWEPTGPALGRGAPGLTRDHPCLPFQNTWYPNALANAICGTDVEPSANDGGLEMCSNCAWYYGTDPNAKPPTAFDFISVVLHELGHVLGFFKLFRIRSSEPTIGLWGLFNDCDSPTVYDRFIENGAGTKLVDVACRSTALKNEMVSDNVFFDGPNANAANGNSRVKVYAPNPWEQGSSIGHVDPSYNSDDQKSLMSPFGGGNLRAPGSLVLGVFKDIGWPTSLSPTGSITVVEDAVPNDAQDFSFATTGAGLSGFVLDDDGTATDPPNTKTFSGIGAGTYTVTQSPVAKWKLESIACTSGGSGTVSNGRATITLVNNQSTVTCTYKNVRYQPDALVKRTTDAAYVGNNIYSPTVQTRAVSGRRSSAIEFNVLVQSEGGATDSFRIKGPAGNAAFSVRYLIGAVDKTTQVVQGTLVLANLGPSASAALKVRITPTTKAATRSSFTANVKATSVALGTSTDTVGAKVTVI